MGCLCSKSDVPNIEGRLPTIKLSEKAESSSDEALKAIGQKKRDIMPLLDGPNLLAFGNLNLSSTSSSSDVDMDHIQKLLLEEEEQKGETQEEDKVDDNQDHFEKTNDQNSSKDN